MVRHTGDHAIGRRRGCFRHCTVGNTDYQNPPAWLPSTSPRPRRRLERIREGSLGWGILVILLAIAAAVGPAATVEAFVSVPQGQQPRRHGRSGGPYYGAAPPRAEPLRRGPATAVRKMDRRQFIVASSSSSDPQDNDDDRSTKGMLLPMETESAVATVRGSEEHGALDLAEGIGGGGTASIPNLVTSLVKSIIGSGVLALPAGMAAMGNVPSQVLPASLVLLALTATLNAGFFVAIGKVCESTHSRTFQQCWDRSVGPEYSTIVSTVITLKTFLSCLAFSIILADSVSSLLDWPRTIVLWTITGTAILPLTLLKDIKSLAPFSALGLAGMGVTSAAMVIRWLDGTYQTNPDGPFVQELASNLRPDFGSMVGGGEATTTTNYLQGVVLACSLATAFMAHYNAPRFHAELSNNTAPRFRAVTLVSYGVSAALFGLVATAGYLTFGGHSQGFILNNYSGSDPLIFASRVALSISILLTYPLPFVGLRDGCMDLLRTVRVGMAPNQQHSPQALPTEEMESDDYEEDEGGVPETARETSSLVSTDKLVTFGLLFFVTVAATFCRDLGLVVSVGGGTFSTAVASVFPTIMLTSLHNKQVGAARDGSSTEVTVAWIGMAISVAIGMTGVWLAISNALG